MSLSLCLTPFASSSPQSHPRIPLSIPRNPTIFPSRKLSKLHPIRSVQEQFDHQPLTRSTPRWENMLSTAASLYPLYVTAGGVVACVKPSVFAWFVEKGPASYSLSLGLIMLSMGITLKLRDFFNLLIQRPFSVSFLWLEFLGVLVFDCFRDMLLWSCITIWDCFVGFEKWV